MEITAKGTHRLRGETDRGLEFEGIRESDNSITLRVSVHHWLLSNPEEQLWVMMERFGRLVDSLLTTAGSATSQSHADQELVRLFDRELVTVEFRTRRPVASEADRIQHFIQEVGLVYIGELVQCIKGRHSNALVKGGTEIRVKNFGRGSIRNIETTLAEIDPRLGFGKEEEVKRLNWTPEGAEHRNQIAANCGP